MTSMKFRAKMKAQSSFNHTEPKDIPMRFDNEFQAKEFCKRVHLGGSGDFVPKREKDGSFSIVGRPVSSKVSRWLDEPVSKNDRLNLD